MTSPVLMPAGHAIVAEDLDAYENLTAAWTTWTPTLANLTATNATITAKYRRTGKTGDFIFSFLLGAGSAVGTLPAFTLPFTLNTANYPTLAYVGSGQLNDTTTANYFAVGRMTATPSVEVVFLGASGIHSVVSATAPFTWVSGDRLTIVGAGLELA